jgi:acetyl-CoA carboxylase biotin carboxyl carrier protein
VESEGSTRPARGARKTHDPTAPDPTEAVEAVLGLVDGTRISDIEVEWNGTHVRVKREPSAFDPGLEKPELTASEDDATTVTSMYVGVFHRHPAAAFPAVGDTVSAGQTIAHVETLRIQNTVVAPVEGTLAELLVDDGTPVEYGQPLVVIRPRPADDAGEGEESFE